MKIKEFIEDFGGCIVVIIIIIALLSLVGLINFSVSEGTKDVTPNEYIDHIHYFEYNGMPCLFYLDSIGYKGFSGLTCDWSKFKQ